MQPPPFHMLVCLLTPPPNFECIDPHLKNRGAALVNTSLWFDCKRQNILKKLDDV